MQDRSLERNQSVLSRKELIKQEYNLLLETRLPNIMQLMNSEKSLGLGLNMPKNGTPEKEAKQAKKVVEKKSVDYDDTEFLEKMFSNADPDIRNLNPKTLTASHSKGELPKVASKQELSAAQQSVATADL